MVANPVRWRLLRELAHSDRAVRELTELVDERQNLVSYHLNQLGDAGLVRSRRSSADQRDRYYSMDLERFREQLQSSGRALHPAMGLDAVPPSDRRIETGSNRRPRVLFLCTGNSARSQMAEALLVEMSHGTIDAVSAGSNPKPLHPNAVRAMKKRGIDISGNRTKHLDEFAAERFDTVITLCDRVREVCPEFPFQPNHVHWSIPDPASSGPNNRATYPSFKQLAAELESRIGFLLTQLEPISTGRSTHG